MFRALVAHNAPAGQPGNLPAPSASLLLAGAMCVLPFLLPYNQPLEAEWLAAALGVAAVFAALATQGNSTVSVPAPARWLAAFALFLGIQAVLVHPVYVQVPILAVLYLLYAVLMIWLGAQLAASAGVERAARTLALCMLAGALANAAAGAIQFYGRPALLDDIVAELPYGAGAYGNIGQANLYANYVALGAAALLFLWLRGNVRSGYAFAAAALLGGTCALAGSRTSILYAAWFALLGLIANKMHSGTEGRRIRTGAYTLAIAIAVAHVLLPWLNAALGLGNAAEGALQRTLSTSPERVEMRWQIWTLAWRVFTEAPVAGVGIGEFAGAAFRSGLPPSLTQFGNQVWTSPHNLPLQLLAETGVLGTFLALGGIFAWCWRVARRYVARAEPAVWWIIATVGIELIHSMFEFPLWNAHFLGVTALLIGLGTLPETASRSGWSLPRTAAAGASVALALALSVLLRDFVRLSETRITGTTLTLAGAADAAHDARVMRTLTRGMLAPAAEYWLVLGAPLERPGLANLLEMSARIVRHYPTNAIVVRRAAFLALEGRRSEARNLLAQGMYTFPKRCQETIRILALALPADPSAIEPLLRFARKLGAPYCD